MRKDIDHHIGSPDGEFRLTEFYQTAKLVQAALAEIQVNHADKAYHGVDHTMGVMRRALKFIDVVKAVCPELVHPRTPIRVVLGAGHHDLVQDFHVVNGRRVRHAPQNEVTSVVRTVAAMRAVVRADGSPFYTEEDIAEVSLSIYHSIAEWDAVNRTVRQPYLTEASSIVSRAIAYADIGSGAIDGPAYAVWDANKLFVEDNIELRERLAAGTLDMAEQEAVRAQILAWTEVQINFVTGRRNRLDTELAGLPENLIAALKSQFFVYYDESVATLRDLLRAREGMSFNELLRNAELA